MSCLRLALAPSVVVDAVGRGDESFPWSNMSCRDGWCLQFPHPFDATSEPMASANDVLLLPDRARGSVAAWRDSGWTELVTLEAAPVDLLRVRSTERAITAWACAGRRCESFDFESSSQRRAVTRREVLALPNTSPWTQHWTAALRRQYFPTGNLSCATRAVFVGTRDDGFFLCSQYAHFAAFRLRNGARAETLYRPALSAWIATKTALWSGPDCDPCASSEYFTIRWRDGAWLVADAPKDEDFDGGVAVPKFGALGDGPPPQHRTHGCSLVLSDGRALDVRVESAITLGAEGASVERLPVAFRFPCIAGETSWGVTLVSPDVLISKRGLPGPPSVTPVASGWVRVIGVAQGDTLMVRTAPVARAPEVTQLAPTARCVPSFTVPGVALHGWSLVEGPDGKHGFSNSRYLKPETQRCE